MGRVTFFKYWLELEKSGAVKITRNVGRDTMYQLDRRSEVVKQLTKLDMALARKSMEKAAEEDKKPLSIKFR